MNDQKKEHPLSLLPREICLLENYFLGLPLYLCAKLAKYRTNSQKKLRKITKEVVEKYGLQASKEEISQRAGGHAAAWWRDLQWTKKRAKARGDLKNMVAVLKMQGEAIGVLKAKELDSEVGATIILSMDSKTRKEPAKPAKKVAGQVLSIATQEGSDD